MATTSSSSSASLPQNELRDGGIVLTPYGVGIPISFREADNVYHVQLPFGRLYLHGDSLLNEEHDEDGNMVMRKKSSSSTSTSTSLASMALNEGYEALEHMRRVNLELACRECGVQGDFVVDHDDCTVCVLEQAKVAANKENIKFPRLKKLVTATSSSHRPDRCLTCASPCCPQHASSTFRKEGITVCHECEGILDLNFLLECLTLDSEQRRQRLYHLMNLYDRTVLLLRYSNQYIDSVATALEKTKWRANRINFGGSSAGIVSGVLGVAAALTILTPAGPPLLLASLLFGGGATAVQTGTEVRHKFFFEPNKVADRILALHGMILSILTVTGTLHEAARLEQQTHKMLDPTSPVAERLNQVYIANRDLLLSDVGGADSKASVHDYLAAAEDEAAPPASNLSSHSTASSTSSNTSSPTSSPKKQRATHNKSNSHPDLSDLVASSTPSKQLPNNKKRGTIITRNTRYMSRIGAGVMRTVQLARFAGGALAAASLLLEVKTMTRTIKSIKAGSPCEKAQALQQILICMPELPTTEQVEQECGAYLAYMNMRSSRPMTAEAAAHWLVKASNKDLEYEEEELDEDMIHLEQGHSILLHDLRALNNNEDGNSTHSDKR